MTARVAPRLPEPDGVPQRSPAGPGGAVVVVVVVVRGRRSVGNVIVGVVMSVVVGSATIGVGTSRSGSPIDDESPAVATRTTAEGLSFTAAAVRPAAKASAAAAAGTRLDRWRGPVTGASIIGSEPTAIYRHPSPHGSKSDEVQVLDEHEALR